MPVTCTNGSRASLTCMASSRVGTRTRALRRFGCGRTPSASRVIVGRPKARVLPDPVRPRPRTSRPASASGMVAAWIGNGSVMPSRASRSTMRSGRPRAAKPFSAVTSRGPPAPVERYVVQVSASARSASASSKVRGRSSRSHGRSAWRPSWRSRRTGSATRGRGRAPDGRRARGGGARRAGGGRGARRGRRTTVSGAGGRRAPRGPGAPRGGDGRRDAGRSLRSTRAPGARRDGAVVTARTVVARAAGPHGADGRRARRGRAVRAALGARRLAAAAGVLAVPAGRALGAGRLARSSPSPERAARRGAGRDRRPGRGGASSDPCGPPPSGQRSNGPSARVPSWAWGGSPVLVIGRRSDRHVVGRWRNSEYNESPDQQWSWAAGSTAGCHRRHRVGVGAWGRGCDRWTRPGVRHLGAERRVLPARRGRPGPRAEPPAGRSSRRREPPEADPDEVGDGVEGVAAAVRAAAAPGPPR